MDDLDKILLAEDDDKTIAALFKDKIPCAHCGGYHTRSCPRVRRIVFKEGSSEIREVEFWPWEQWPHDAEWIIWPEDIPVVPQ